MDDNRKISDMTIAEVNTALLEMGLLEKSMERFCKNVFGINPNNQDEINSFREDLSFVRSCREFLKKILVAVLTGLFWVTGLTLLYSVIEHKIFK